MSFVAPRGTTNRPLLNRLRTGRIAIPLLTALLLLASTATVRAQEQGVRELEHYQSVSPREEIPSLSTGFVTLTPDTELDLGFTRLHAFLGERILFDDNLFLASSGEKSDVVFLTTPGVLAQSFFGDHRLTVSYSPTWRGYGKHNELNVWDHDASADLRLDFVDAYARVSDSFLRTQDVRDINFGGKVNRTQNTFAAEAGILLDDLGFGVRGEHRLRNYGAEIPRFEDLTERTLGVFAHYVRSEDYSWQLEYALLMRDFKGSVLNDSVTHTVLAGLEGRPTEDLQFLVKAGPVWVRADHDGSVGDDSDLFDLEVQAEATATLRPDLTGSLFYVQRPEYSTFSNYQKIYRGGLSLSWDADPGWVTVRSDLFLERANPSNEPQLSLVGAGLAADVNVTRWLKVGAGYEWRRRLGEGDLDYTSNQLYLQAVLYF